MSILDVFKSPSDKRIESATSEVHIGADWQTFMDISDSINGSPDGGKDILSAIKKRIQNKNAHVAELSLTLLETCVKNCFAPFHTHVATRDFLDALVKVTTKKDQKVAIREQGLSLIQAWAEAFDKAGRFPIFMEYYQKLRQKGEMFPARDSNAAPIFTPLTHAHEKPGSGGSSAASGGHAPTAVSVSTDDHKTRAQANASSQANVNPLSYCSPEYVLKIKTDLQVVVNYMKVLRDMLLASGDAQTLRQDGAVASLVSTLTEVRSRLSRLMVEIDNEQLMDFAIRFTEQTSILLNCYHDKLNGKFTEMPKDLDIPESIAQLEEKPKLGAAGGGAGGAAGKQMHLFDADVGESKGEHKSQPVRKSSESESDPFAALALRSPASASKPKSESEVFDGFDKLAMRQAQAQGTQYVPPSPQRSPMQAPAATPALSLLDDPLGLSEPTPAAHSTVNVSDKDLEDLLSLTDAKPVQQPQKTQDFDELMQIANRTANAPTSQKGLFDP